METTIFQNKYDADKRKNMFKSLVKDNPNRIPIIIEKKKNATLPNLDKKKYLVPTNMTVATFSFLIRKRLLLDSSEALVLTFGDNGLIENNSALLCDVYSKHANDDGFLYAIYNSEQTFG